VVATPPERVRERPRGAKIARACACCCEGGGRVRGNGTALPVDLSSKSYGTDGTSCATRRSQERATGCYSGSWHKLVGCTRGPEPAERRTARPAGSHGWSSSAHRRHLLCLHLLHFCSCVLELGFVPGLTDPRENVLLLFPNMAFEARVHCLELGEPRRVVWVELR
jgi:hypothetical protein